MRWISEYPGYQKDYTSAVLAAGLLGAEIASARRWSDEWARRWAECVADAARESAGEGTAIAFWRSLAGNLLDEAVGQKKEGNPPPEGWQGGYTACVSATNTSISEEDRRKAEGLYDQIVGAVVATAQDVKETGKQTAAAVKSAGSSSLLKIGGLLLLGGIVLRGR